MKSPLEQEFKSSMAKEGKPLFIIVAAIYTSLRKKSKRKMRNEDSWGELCCMAINENKLILKNKNKHCRIGPELETTSMYQKSQGGQTWSVKMRFHIVHQCIYTKLTTTWSHNLGCQKTRGIINFQIGNSKGFRIRDLMVESEGLLPLNPTFRIIYWKKYFSLQVNAVNDLWPHNI